jgi:hypothetical protein
MTHDFGDLLALGRRSDGAIEDWLTARDRALLDQIRLQAQIRRERLGQFVRIAVADFLSEADEEAWASLLSAMRDADDPGAQCLARMVAFRLRLETAT